MAQAMQMAFEETAALPFSEVEKIVKEMLKSFKKMPARIRAAQRRESGKGYAPIGRKLSEHEKHLAAVAKRYGVHEQGGQHVHVEKAENILNAVRSDDYHHEHALDELRGIFAGTEAFGDDGMAIGGIVVTEDAYWQIRLSTASELQEQYDLILEALDDLDGYDARSALILRLQYIEWKTVDAVIVELQQVERKREIADRTYHEWRRKAVAEFATLMGLI